jgi:hypothetical protein
MGDQGVIRRATFGFKNPLYSVWIEGISPQSIHRFGWKRDQLSVDQQIRCRLDLLDLYALRSSHRRIALLKVFVLRAFFELTAERRPVVLEGTFRSGSTGKIAAAVSRPIVRGRISIRAWMVAQFGDSQLVP